MTKPTRLAGRRAVVTGAGGPMGYAIAERLLAEGLEGLALTDISGTRLTSTAEALSAAHPEVRIVALRGDVTVAAEAKAFAGTVLDTLGGADILVNVVGGIRSRQLYTPFLEMSEAQWKATFDINLLGNFHLVQAFAPGMLERGEGRIINLSSIVFGSGRVPPHSPSPPGRIPQQGCGSSRRRQPWRRHSLLAPAPPRKRWRRG